MKLECVLILLVHITANKSLFLDESTIASTGQSSDIFQQVLDLSRNETRRLQNYVYVMEQKLNNINVALEQKINKSEQEIAMLSKELKEEKSRGVKLQMYSDELTFKFYNLSVEYARVMSRMQSLENQNAELKISVNNLTTIFGGVDLSTLMTDHTDLLELKRKQDYNMVFTATAPKDGPVSGMILFKKFTYEHSTTRDHYNLATGKFLCGLDGYYFFSLSVIKVDTADHAWCYIRKNGTNMVQIGVDPPPASDSGFYTATNSVILHLRQGDTVDLGGCSPADTMYLDTAFTGFLLKAN